MKDAILLLIDMQRASFYAPRHDATALIGRLDVVARSMRGAGARVILVQHESGDGDLYDPTGEGFPLVDGLAISNEDIRLRKRYCDAFVDTELESLLSTMGCSHLLIGGCATDFCVDATVRSSLGRGHRTVILADGHTTSDRGPIDAPSVIAHHNEIWRDFSFACRRWGSAFLYGDRPVSRDARRIAIALTAMPAGVGSRQAAKGRGPPAAARLSKRLVWKLRGA